MPIEKRLRVVALTSTNSEHHLTWRLRVECMLPHLQRMGIDVDPVHLSKDRQWYKLRGYDIAWLHRHTMSGTDLKEVRQIANSLVLDIDDPVHLSSSHFLNFSLGRWWRFRATARACTAILAASSGLVADARVYNSNVHYVPLCADPEAYSMTARPRPAGSPLRLLWIGSRSTFKYLEGVREHLEAIGKTCRNVELTVVGHAHLKLNNMAVHNVPWSVQADRAALDSSHVGLAPLCNDRWTRSKAALKPLQYLASGIPFLGNPIGVLNEIADDGRNAILADRPNEWVAAVRQLEEDESRRLGMGQRGVEFVRQKHSADVLARKVGVIFHGIAGATPSQKTRIAA